VGPAAGGLAVVDTGSCSATTSPDVASSAVPILPTPTPRFRAVYQQGRPEWMHEGTLEAALLEGREVAFSSSTAGSSAQDTVPERLPRHMATPRQSQN
jgi:hypothetical protein